MQRYSRFIFFGCLLGIAAGGLAWSMGELQPSPTPPQAVIPDEARARLAEYENAVRSLWRGDATAASELARRMIDHPSSDKEQVEGLRLLSQTFRASGDLTVADATLLAAIALVERSATLNREDPSLRAAIVMDRADLACFAARDHALALSLYDEVAASGSGARLRDVRLAMQNAAMLCEHVGRRDEAIQRVDALLASPAASLIPREDLPKLRASQAGWIVKTGNLAEARRRYLAIWNEFHDRDDPVVLQAGVYLAGWTPQPRECAERLRWCRFLLARFADIRQRPDVHPGHPTATELDDLERQVQFHIANSEDCGDLEFVDQARSRLGLPRRSR